MPNSLKSLLPCPCGAAVDEEECPYPARPPAHDGRELWKVSCSNPECGWSSTGWGADGARRAWNTRAPIAEGGGDREVASFESWARRVFSHGSAEVFDRIGERPANRLGLTWEYNGDRVQAAWAAWIERAAIESLSRQGGEAVAELIHSADALTRLVVLPEGMQLGYGTHKLYASPTRASEAGDWVLVPRVPTDEMLNASQEEMCRWSARTYHNDDEQTAIYKAMLAAAAPAPGGGD